MWCQYSNLLNISLLHVVLILASVSLMYDSVDVSVQIVYVQRVKWREQNLTLFASVIFLKAASSCPFRGVYIVKCTYNLVMMHKIIGLYHKVNVNITDNIFKPDETGYRLSCNCMLELLHVSLCM